MTMTLPDADLEQAQRDAADESIPTSRLSGKAWALRVKRDRDARDAADEGASHVLPKGQTSDEH